MLQDREVLYERYFNNTQRDSIVTSFSVAKSFTSALIGIAIEEGFIGDENDPATDYLPELAQDPRGFQNPWGLLQPPALPVSLIPTCHP